MSMCATVDDLRYTLSPRQWVEHVERRSLFPWQAAVLDDPSPFIVIDGARQGGKSTVVVKPAAHSAKYYPGSLTVIAAATESQAIEDMMNGNIDAVVCDSLIASDFVLANKNYQGKMAVVGQPFTQEDIAIAVKKGNATLLDLIDKGLKALQADGSLDTLKRKWNLL